MSPYVMTRVTDGRAERLHLGLVRRPALGHRHRGRLAIEWEDDVEILSKGDIFHCPAGPPGHRLEAADPATLIDLTPFDRLESGGRLAEWRRGTARSASGRSRGIAVAAARLSRARLAASAAGSASPARRPRRRRAVIARALARVLVGRLDRGRVLGHRRLARLEPGQHDLGRRGDRHREQRPDEPADRPADSRLSRTSSGEMPTVLRMTSGTRTLPSMSWSTT